MSDSPIRPDVCPVCGSDVPPGARACPDCGADERTGWDEEATRCDGLDLPDPEFDHGDFERREFDGQPVRSGRGRTWIPLVAAVVVIVLLLLWGGIL